MKRTFVVILALMTAALMACGKAPEPVQDVQAGLEGEEEEPQLGPQVEWAGGWLAQNLGLKGDQDARVLTALRELEMALVAGREEGVRPRQYVRISEDAWWTFEDSLREGLTFSRQKALRRLPGGMLTVRLVMELELTPEQSLEAAAIASELGSSVFGTWTRDEGWKRGSTTLTEAWQKLNVDLGQVLNPEQIRRYRVLEKSFRSIFRDRFEADLARDREAQKGETGSGE